MDKTEKVQILFWINKSIDTKFRKLIQDKYPQYEKGLLSYEAELALRNWLAIHKNAQTQLIKPNPIPKVQIAFAQVKNYLLATYYFELFTGSQIQLKHIKQAIEAVRGTDPRTVTKWLKTFRKFDLIKPISGQIWEIM